MLKNNDNNHVKETCFLKFQDLKGSSLLKILNYGTASSIGRSLSFSALSELDYNNLDLFSC